MHTFMSLLALVHREWELWLYDRHIEHWKLTGGLTTRRAPITVINKQTNKNTKNKQKTPCRISVVKNKQNHHFIKGQFCTISATWCVESTWKSSLSFFEFLEVTTRQHRMDSTCIYTAYGMYTPILLEHGASLIRSLRCSSTAPQRKDTRIGLAALTRNTTSYSINCFTD